MADRYYNPPRWQMPLQGGYNPPRSRFWSPPPVVGQPVDPTQEMMWPDQMPPEMAQDRAQAAIARMQAQAIQQPMPGDMPVGAPIPQTMPPQGFAPQPASMGDPVSPTGGQRPTARLNPGGAMPSTTPDVIQTAMAPVGGSAGPGTEIYGETYPTAPMPPMPQPPSAARGVIEEAMANRGDRAPWLALAAAGFGTAAGTSPHAMTNIGQGGLKGIQMYSDMTDRAARDRLAAATALMRAEQDDRQAGFEQQKIGQGAERIGVEREGLGIRRGEIQQRREEAAAKLRHEERKLDIEQPFNKARADYFTAQAEYTRGAKSIAAEGQGDARRNAVVTSIDQRAREYAKAATPGDETTRDPVLFRKNYEEHAAAMARNAGIDPAVFGIVPTMPADPKDWEPGRVYKNQHGVAARWTGSGWKTP